MVSAYVVYLVTAYIATAYTVAAYILTVCMVTDLKYGYGLYCHDPV